ncbi:DUF6892 domain-containing protein [Virgisporangium aliadipatigenens]|uniref:DUF6892 domain-containing protein n=1 Tax=Virgisporangium aliadipatigenens TaxID=741659 RepID=UPI00194321CC|nr:hypothetical protein [Virgisporangium aliadipatigenens]
MDVNLRLAIVDTLTRAGVLPRFDVDAFNETPEGALKDGESPDDRDFRYRQEVVDALLAIPISQDQLAATEELTWSDSSDLTMFAIYAQNDGGGDEFDIRSFDGIAETLPNLRKLVVDYFTKASDLSPLTGLTKLHELHIRGGFPVADIGPLARIPSLRVLSLDSQNVNDLRPLAATRIEELTIRNNGLDRDKADDLAPLADMPALRALSYTPRCSYPERTVTPDNARLLDRLRARGVTVTA